MTIQNLDKSLEEMFEYQGLVSLTCILLVLDIYLLCFICLCRSFDQNPS